MTKSKLTIVILSYNVEQLLLNCIASITGPWEIIVVDNASSDNSVASVKAKFPKVKVIETGKNLGFAGGNNVALRNITSKYVLLLNPDTIVYPNTLETVLEFMEKHPEAGAATCRVELLSGALDYSCHRSFPNPWDSFLHFYSGFFRKLSRYSHASVPEFIHEIDSLTGAFALIRTKVGHDLKWLDEDFFWNGEDLDFCYRLKQKGWKVFYIPDVKITHLKGASSQQTKQSRARWALRSTDAMLTFYRKHFASKYPVILNLTVYVGIYLLRTLRYLKAHL